MRNLIGKGTEVGLADIKEAIAQRLRFEYGEIEECTEMGMYQPRENTSVHSEQNLSHLSKEQEIGSAVKWSLPVYLSSYPIWKDTFSQCHRRKVK